MVMRHLHSGGAPVSKGIRYIIPLFLYLHENGSGRPKGYITKSLVPLAEVKQPAMMV